MKTDEHSPSGGRVKVFVFGSCVSRDAFVTCDPSLELVRYLARSSLACALRRRPARADVDLSRITSPWGRRMVEVDLARQLPLHLRNADYDLLLLDLIDERFQIAILGREPVTLSNELLATGIKLDGARSLNPSDPMRMAMWVEGLDRFMALADPAKVVLNRVFWATHAETGEPLVNAARIASANRTLNALYDELLGRHKVRTIDYPAELLVADSDHRWGLSPFHYVSATYRHTVDRLKALGSRLSDDTSRI